MSGRRFRVRVEETEVDVEVQTEGERTRVLVGGRWLEVFSTPDRSWRVVGEQGQAHHIVTLEPGPRPSAAAVAGRTLSIQMRTQQEAALAEALAAAGGASGAGATVASPMPGRVVAVLVELEQSVERDQPLVIVEAMKMENEVRAPAAGVVRRIGPAAGETVNAGDLLIELSPHPDS